MPCVGLVQVVGGGGDLPTGSQAAQNLTSAREAEEESHCLCVDGAYVAALGAKNTNSSCLLVCGIFFWSIALILNLRSSE